MKKILLFLSFCLAVAATQAQSVPPAYLQPQRVVLAADTNTNAQTTYVQALSMGSHLKSFQIDNYNVTGADSGTASIYGTVGGSNWVSLGDTLKLPNSANTAVFPISGTIYNSYQVKFTTTNVVAKAYIIVSYLRREDE